MLSNNVHVQLEYGEVFGGLDYPHDLAHDLSERTFYIPSASLCCCNQQRVITPSDHGVAGCGVLDKGLAVCSHPTKTVRNEQYHQLVPYTLYKKSNSSLPST
jgi:hypothetical protein